jgi:hypothetical protein
MNAMTTTIQPGMPRAKATATGVGLRSLPWIIGGAILAKAGGFQPAAGAFMGLGIGVSLGLRRAKEQELLGSAGSPVLQDAAASVATAGMADADTLKTAWNYWTKWGVRGGLENVAYEAEEAAAEAAGAAGGIAAAAQQAYKDELERREQERKRKRMERILKIGGLSLLGLVIAGGVAGRAAGGTRRRNPAKDKGPSWLAVGLVTALAAADTVTPGFPFPGSAVVLVPAAAATWLAKLSAMGVKLR